MQNREMRAEQRREMAREQGQQMQTRAREFGAEMETAGRDMGQRMQTRGRDQATMARQQAGRNPGMGGNRGGTSLYRSFTDFDNPGQDRKEMKQCRKPESWPRPD